jgi:hypothetical protein
MVGAVIEKKENVSVWTFLDHLCAIWSFVGVEGMRSGSPPLFTYGAFFALKSDAAKEVSCRRPINHSSI